MINMRMSTKIKKTYNKTYKNNDGFTLIELLIVLSLIGIVASCVMTFFISYVRVNNMVSAETELQYEARKITNFILDKAMESEGIVLVTDALGDCTASTGEITLKALNFKNISGEYYSFVVDNGNIYYQNVSSPTSTADITNINNRLGSYIDEIKIKPVNAVEFNRDNLIKLSLYLDRDGEQYSLVQNICLRNK